jgi:hypothetical protein
MFMGTGTQQGKGTQNPLPSSVDILVGEAEKTHLSNVTNTIEKQSQGEGEARQGTFEKVEEAPCRYLRKKYQPGQRSWGRSDVGE